MRIIKFSCRQYIKASFNRIVSNYKLVWNIKKYHQREILKEFQELAADKSCQICYSLIENGNDHHPMFVFELTLQRGILTNEQVHLRGETLSGPFTDFVIVLSCNTFMNL